LPAKPSFRMTIGSVFELSNAQIVTAFKSFRELGFSFSTRRVREATKVGIDEARSVRRGVLELTEEISKLRKQKAKLVKELEELGYSKEKVGSVVSLVMGFPKESLKVCHNLLVIDSYVVDLPHLEDLSTEVHHALSDVKDGVMFPLVQVVIATHISGETREISFTIDANDFEHFVDSLADTLELVRKESRIVKKGMGLRFTSLVDK